MSAPMSPYGITKEQRQEGAHKVNDDYTTAGLDAVAQNVAAISHLISASYPPELDHEAHTWRRVMKITEEAGEVFNALAGSLGENPRKGYTHTRADVMSELLDVALAALGAWEYLDFNQGRSIASLSLQADFVLGRLRKHASSRDEATA